MRHTLLRNPVLDKSAPPRARKRNTGIAPARQPDLGPGNLLEAAADALLKAHGLLGPKHGIYTSSMLDSMIDEEPELTVGRFPRRDEHLEYVIKRKTAELIDVSKLNPLEEIIFRLRVSGTSLADLPSEVFLSKRATRLHLRRAMRKVRAALREGRYAGWYDVYLSEVNRPAYRFQSR